MRRDLRELAAEGLCVRVYGGAVPKAPNPAAFALRAKEAPREKAELARAAAALVKPRSVVLIDAGTTNLAIARALPAELDLTILTNAPEIALAMAERGHINILLIGGRFDPKIGGATGAAATREVARLRPDLFFLGACAIDPDVGVCAFDGEEAEFKRAALEASAVTVAVATREKLGSRAPFVIGPLAAIAHLVVEKGADVSAFLGERRPEGWIVIADNEEPV